MNGTHASLDEARAIAAAASEHPAIDVALCPPATLIAAMSAALPGFAIGGQDCHEAASGAFTGSISAPMLADAGARLTIVGHSERREGCGETSAMVRAKAAAALAAGLDVILCVGESRAVREAGEAEGYVLHQISESFPVVVDPARLAIAYEPIWAIGTGLTPTIADIAAMHGAMRGALGGSAPTTRLLYGGSVTADNAGAILSASDVDGALVGGASLTAAKFLPIIRAAAG